MNYASFFSSDVTAVTGCAAGADTGRATGSAGFGAAVAAGFSTFGLRGGKLIFEAFSMTEDVSSLTAVFSSTPLRSSTRGVPLSFLSTLRNSVLSEILSLSIFSLEPADCVSDIP